MLSDDDKDARFRARERSYYVDKYISLVSRSRSRRRIASYAPLAVAPLGLIIRIFVLDNSGAVWAYFVAALVLVTSIGIASYEFWQARKIARQVDIARAELNHFFGSDEIAQFALESKKDSLGDSLGLTPLVIALVTLSVFWSPSTPSGPPNTAGSAQVELDSGVPRGDAGVPSNPSSSPPIASSIPMDGGVCALNEVRDSVGHCVPRGPVSLMAVPLCSYTFPMNACPRAVEVPSGVNKIEHGLLLCGMKGTLANRAVLSMSSADGQQIPSDYLYQVRVSVGPSGYCGSPAADHDIPFKAYIPGDRKGAFVELLPEAFEGAEEAYFCVTAKNNVSWKVSGKVLVKKVCEKSE